MLITEEYRALNKKLHENPHYGTVGRNYADRIMMAVNRTGSRDILDYGCGKRTLEKTLGFPIRNYDPAIDGVNGDPKPADIVACTDVLEHIEPECLEDVLDHLAQLTRTVAYLYIENTPARKILADGRNAHLIQKPADWWMEKLSKRFNILGLQYGKGGFELVCGKGKCDPRIACYELAFQPTTFDFATFLVTATTLGATHIRFVHRGKLKPKDYSEEESWRRLENILYPLCKAIGVEYSFGEPLGISYQHIFSQVLGAYRDKGCIRKFAGTPKKSGYVTVTMRESRKPTRNSNRPEWEKFIKWCPQPVEVIEDFSVKPISLKDRLDLYAGADLNLMVANGPALVCHFSDMPIMEIKYINASPEFFGNLQVHGIEHGFQWPFKSKRQKIVWQDDTFENIKAAYLELMQ